MAWLPLVGPWVERVRIAMKIIGMVLQHRKEGVGERRAKLEKALTDLDKPIVVVLDDIDRLSTSEIRDVFKLVRLTASFPNIIYIVAFDRDRVEDALAEQRISGRDYLEKILQVAVDLPAVPYHVLNREIFSAIDEALVDIENRGPFDEEAWPDVFMEVVRPLIRNMRDVRRYAVAIHGTVRALNGQIALTDVLALEAVRVFLPDVYKRLHGAIDGLTTTADFGHGGESKSVRLKMQIDDLLESAGTNCEVVRSMIIRLFPAGQRHISNTNYGSNWKGRWLRERRIAHENLLLLYFERVAGESLQAFTDAERAWAYMTDRQALDDYLRSLDTAQLQDVIASLEVYEDQFTSVHVVPGIIVLLNLLPDLPERQREMFGMGSRIVVSRVTYRLLKSLGDPGTVESAVRQILPQLTSLSSKMELIQQVGYREGAGHKLVSEAAAAEFEKSWRDEVRSASADALIKEREIMWVLLHAKREAELSEQALNIDSSPELTYALLRAARSEALSQTIGSRAVRRSAQLAWNALVEICGDEATLSDRIESLRATLTDSSDDILILSDKYLAGWRPERDD